MEDIFAELSAIEGINGIIFFSKSGEILYKNLLHHKAQKMNESSLTEFLDQSALVDEMEFVFENGRIYLKKMDAGVLLLFLSSFAPVAMIRVHCDLIRPQLVSNNANGKKKSRFFGVF